MINIYPYKTAISSAKSSIVISSPKLFISERNVLVELLTESLHKGIEILIITTTKNEHTEQLQAKGLYVKVIPNLSLCTTIIDKTIVWYGAINTLGYVSEEDNVIKVTDNNLANELTNTLFQSIST